jgi:PAP2 superfamily
MNHTKRIQYLIVTWGLVALVYYGCARFATHQPITLYETFLDHLIPFNTIGIWLYFSFFIFVPYHFLTIPKHKIQPLSKSIVYAALIAGLMFLYFPTHINGQQRQITTITTNLNLNDYIYLLLQQNDTQYNCLPSLHAALTALCTIYAITPTKTYYNNITIIWAILILFSVIQIRQHLFFDLTAGILLATLIYLIQIVVKKKHKY